jgi:putative endonuclease
MSKVSARVLGAEAEARALSWLQAQGLRLVAQNFASKYGEIDLIMRDGEILIFVEVRMRSELAWATGAESVDKAKRKRIVACAKFFLLQAQENAKRTCRFDVLALDDASPSGLDRSQWIKNAFGDGWW